jgi:hypothetical protein
LSIANHHASLPVAYRLYLPKDWADEALQQSACSRGDQIQDQAADRAGALGLPGPSRMPIRLRATSTSTPLPPAGAVASAGKHQRCDRCH